MPLTNFVVIKVMGRGYLDATAAEFGIDMLIGNDGNRPPGQRQFNFLADQIGISFIIRVHGNGCIAQHSLGPGGGYHKILNTTQRLFYWITDMPEMAIFFLRDDFQIRDGGTQGRIPID